MWCKSWNDLLRWVHSIKLTDLVFFWQTLLMALLNRLQDEDWEPGQVEFSLVPRYGWFSVWNEQTSKLSCLRLSPETLQVHLLSRGEKSEPTIDSEKPPYFGCIYYIIILYIYIYIPYYIPGYNLKQITTSGCDAATSFLVLPSCASKQTKKKAAAKTPTCRVISSWAKWGDFGPWHLAGNPSIQTNARVNSMDTFTICFNIAQLCIELQSPVYLMFWYCLTNLHPFHSVPSSGCSRLMSSRSTWSSSEYHKVNHQDCGPGQSQSKHWETSW